MPERAYDDITKLATFICDTPIALISLVDKDRQWFKSRQGLGVSQTPRQASFCAHNLDGATDLLVIEDARMDDRFAQNPLVNGEPNIVFYAGAPLVTADGFVLGSLCVIDKKPRQLSGDQQHALLALGRQVMNLIELHQANQQLAESNKKRLEEAEQERRGRIDFSQSEATLLSFFEQSPIGIALLDDQELSFRMANPFYGSLVGRTPEQLVGLPLLEALPELKGQGFDELLKEVLRTGIPYVAREVACNLIKDGNLETIYVDLAYQPRQNSSTGLVSGILVVATDVTLQVLSQRKLQSDQKRLETILREVPVGILIADAKGQLIYGNPPVEQIFRHPFRESKDMDAYERWQLFDPETNEPFPLESMPMVRTLLKGETVVGAEMKLLRGDGTWGYATVNSVPVFDASGNVEIGVAAFIDITNHKLAEEQLRKNEELLRTMIESISDGIYVGGLEGITLANQAALDQLGFSTREELNRNIAILADEIQTRNWKTGELIPVERQAFARALGGEHVTEDVLVRHRLTGQQHVVRCAASPVVIEGNTIAAIAINTDVTVQRNAEEALRQSHQQYQQLSMHLEKMVDERTHELTIANQDLVRSNENLQQFAYVASHDLQEPLRKIQAFSSMLTRDLQDQLTDRSRDYIRRINNAGARMSELINDLLAFSRVSTRQQHHGLVSLDAVIADILVNFDLLIEQRGVQILINELPVVQGDQMQLSQLFENLLSNAIKFTPPDRVPKISISSEVISSGQLPALIPGHAAVKAYHQISVTDEGIGFDTKYLDRIFQVFQRLHGKGEYPGTGVGLAICKRVVENHRGELYASSTLGKGATFFVYLPIE